MHRTPLKAHINRVRRRVSPAVRSSGRANEASRVASLRTLEIASYAWAAQRHGTNTNTPTRCNSSDITDSNLSRLSLLLFSLKACVQRGSWNVFVRLRWWKRDTRVVAVNLHYEHASSATLCSHVLPQDRLLLPSQMGHARRELQCVSNASLLISSSASRLFLQRCAYAARAPPSTRQGLQQAMLWGADAVWYVRQIEKQVMTRDDIAVILSETSPHVCRSRQALVVGCIFSREAMSWGEGYSPSALLQMLPVKDRAAIVSFCFASSIPVLHPSRSQSTEGSLHSFLGLVLSHKAVTWEDALVLLRGLETKLGLFYRPNAHHSPPHIDAESNATDTTRWCRFGGYIVTNTVNHNLVDPAWVAALTQRILRDCNDAPLLMRSITFAELLLSSDQVATLCSECGFTDEAAIYTMLAARARGSHMHAGSKIPWHVTEDYRVVLESNGGEVSAHPSASNSTFIRRTLLGCAVSHAEHFASSLRTICLESLDAEETSASSSDGKDFENALIEKMRSECNELCVTLHSTYASPAIETASREMGVSVVLAIARSLHASERAHALRPLLVQCALSMLTWTQILSQDGEGSVPPLYPSTVTLRDAAWKVHREHEFPSEQTARILLSATHSWDDVPRAAGAMSYAGIDAAMLGLHTMQSAYPQDTYYVSVALNPLTELAEKASRPRWQRLLFEARPTTVWNGETGGAAEWRGGNSTGSEAAALGPLSSPQVSHSLWSKCLALLSQHPISVLERSPALHRLLGGVSESYVAAVASSVPQLTPPILSNWLEEYSRTGRWEAAMLVLRAAHDHRVTPFMEPIVTLLERHSDGNEEVLRRLVSTVSVCCPKSAAYVFRAYAERAALAGVEEEESMSWASALRILSASAVLGIGHYPASCLQCIAQHAPSTAVRTALQIISQPPAGALESGYSIHAGEVASQHRSTPSSPTPAPMEVHALRRLVSACARLQLNPEIDVYVVSASRKRVAWWSSDAPSGGVPAVSRLLRSQQVGLWNVALSEVACAAYWRTHSLKGHEGTKVAQQSTSSTIHNAVRLAAFGSRDPQVVLQAVKHAERFDAGRVRSQHHNTRNGSMRFHMGGATRACVAGVLAARGDWVMALSAVPVSTAAAPQPKVAQRARLHALTLSSRLRHQANLALRAQEGSDVPRFHRGLRSRSDVLRFRSIKRRASRKATVASKCNRAPPGVRRLVNAHEMHAAFPWWKNWGH